MWWMPSDEDRGAPNDRKEARDQSSHGEWGRDGRTGSHRTSLHRQGIVD